MNGAGDPRGLGMHGAGDPRGLGAHGAGNPRGTRDLRRGALGR